LQRFLGSYYSLISEFRADAFCVIDKMLEKILRVSSFRLPSKSTLAPPLGDMFKDWNIVVRFGDRFERVYRRGDPTKDLLVEFEGV
jgi:hypothetical protein